MSAFNRDAFMTKGAATGNMPKNFMDHKNVRASPQMSLYQAHLKNNEASRRLAQEIWQTPKLTFEEWPDPISESKFDGRSPCSEPVTPEIARDGDGYAVTINGGAVFRARSESEARTMADHLALAGTGMGHDAPPSFRSSEGRVLNRYVSWDTSRPAPTRSKK